MLIKILKIKYQLVKAPHYLEEIVVKLDLAHRKTDANLFPPERPLAKASEPSFELEEGAQGQI